MKKAILVLSGLLVVGSTSLKEVKAQYNDPNSYASDKLLNAEAQLATLQEQEKAIKKLIKAVKQDLKAAKTRAKAERIQGKADALRGDASTQVAQTGLAIELPDFMTSEGVRAKLAKTPEDTDLNFGDKSATKSVFFPKGNSGGIENDLILPPDAQNLK